jgi:hypothetical protein
LQAEDVLSHYLELTTVNSSQSCAAFYRRLASGGVEGGTPGGYSKPLPSDFIADVETIARKSLTPLEYKMFRAMYLEPGDVKYGANRSAINAIHRKLGQVFEEHGLWPVSAYFKVKDLRKAQDAR